MVIKIQTITALHDIVFTYFLSQADKKIVEIKGHLKIRHEREEANGKAKERKIKSPKVLIFFT